LPHDVDVYLVVKEVVDFEDITLLYDPVSEDLFFEKIHM